MKKIFFALYLVLLANLSMAVSLPVDETKPTDASMVSTYPKWLRETRSALNTTGGGIINFGNYTSGLIRKSHNYVAQQSFSDIVIAGPVVDPRYYGIKLDGSTDDKAAMQVLVNFLSDGGNHTINLFDKTLYLATPLQLMPGVSIVNGTIKGSINVGADAVEGGTPVDFKNPRIENVHFRLPSKVNGTYALRYSMAAYAGFVRGCTFENYDIPLWVPPLTVTVTNQFVTRLSVIDNKYVNCNYFIKTDTVSPMQFGGADFIISGNEGEAKIDNLHLENLDGAIISNNTFFQEGHNGHSSIKGYNVYLKHVNWIQLSSNNYFEAGLDAIHAETFNNISIIGGSIAYPGQRIPSAGIWLGGGVEGGMNGNNSSVTGVTIQWPSLSGIVVDSTISNVAISGNSIYGAGTANIDGVPQVYYGATDLSSLTHYGIDINSAAQYIVVSNNLSPVNSNNLPNSQTTGSFYGNVDSSQNIVTVPKLLSLTGTETSINTTGITQVRLTQSGPTTITSVTNGVDGQEIFFIAYNANTTLKDSNAFKLRDRTDTNMPAGTTLVMRWVSDCWREVARNYTPLTLSVNSISNVASANNSTLNLSTVGTKITRNTSDSGTVLTVQQLDPTATGYSQIWLNPAGAEIAHIDKDGYIVSAVGFKPVPVAFSALGTVGSAGVTKYCNNCTTAATCASGGTGHMAVSNGTNWTCQ